MSNYIQNQLHVKDSNIGVDYADRFAKLDKSVESVIRDIKVVGNDTIEFETRNAPPVEILQKLSKQYRDVEMIHTFNDEGRFCIDEQIKFKNGNIEGYRARYNDGEEVQSYPDWKPFPKTSKEREDSIQECISNPVNEHVKSVMERAKTIPTDTDDYGDLQAEMG